MKRFLVFWGECIFYLLFFIFAIGLSFYAGWDYGYEQGQLLILKPSAYTFIIPGSGVFEESKP